MHNAKTKKLVAVLSFWAVAIFVYSGGETAYAAELRVGAGGEFATIAAALEAANDGDSIYVSPGEYSGNLVIEKSVRLIGEGMPRIVGDYNGDAVLVRAKDVEVSAFAVSGSGANMMYGHSGIKVNGGGALIQNNTLTDNLFGIYLRNCDGARVLENQITGRKDKDQGQRGAGIQVFDSNNNLIKGNEVSFVRDGVYFDHADFNAVEDNGFQDLRYGVHYMYCDDNVFSRNTFKDSSGGIAIMYTRRVTFSDNLIINNRIGFNAFGLLYKEASDCLAERNVIINAVTGIFVEGSRDNIFRNNLIAYNDVGLSLYANSLGNLFAQNDFIGNLSDLKTVGRASANLDLDGRGNYYSSYTGFDVDGDGVGDVPHSLQNAFEHLEGDFPVLRMYLSSGAADAMILAEKTFPLISQERPEDRYPLMSPASGLRLGDFGYGEPAASPVSAIIALLATCGLLLAGWRLSK